MGQARPIRTAVDSRGKWIDVIDRLGDDDAVDPHQYFHWRFSRYTLCDGTPLCLELDNRTLYDDKHGKLYTLR